MYEENLLFQDEIPDAICMLLKLLLAKIALVSDYTQLLCADEVTLAMGWQKLQKKYSLNSFSFWGHINLQGLFLFCTLQLSKDASLFI